MTQTAEGVAFQAALDDDEETALATLREFYPGELEELANTCRRLLYWVGFVQRNPSDDMTLPSQIPEELSVPYDCLSVLRAGGLLLALPRSHGPSGMLIPIQRGRQLGSIVVSQGPVDGEEWLHASIAWHDHMPSYEDLQLLHRAMFGRRRYAFQVFAPAEKHIDGEAPMQHRYALHLWGRADGTNPMPDFGVLGTI